MFSQEKITKLTISQNCYRLIFLLQFEALNALESWLSTHKFSKYNSNFYFFAISSCGPTVGGRALLVKLMLFNIFLS